MKAVIQDAKKIAVFRALVIGDLLCTVPALRSLRMAFPDAHITLIGLPWAREFVQRFSLYLDDFLEFPGYPGLPERHPELTAIPSFFTQAQNSHFDLAIQMHGSGSFVNSITALLVAKHTAGFYVPGEYCPDPDLFMPFPEQEHEIRKYLQLMNFLEFPAQSEDLEFPLMQQDLSCLLKLDETKHFFGKDYICIHPGARLQTRRWKPDGFAEVAHYFVDHGFEIVLTGTSAEAPLVNQISSALHARHYNLAGKTSLGAMGILLKNSRLLISNDTGVSHLAAALKVPSVIVITGSDPARWAPLDINLHRTVSAPVNCRPCYFNECPIGKICAQGVSSETVIETAEKLLTKRDNHWRVDHALFAN